MISHLSFDAVRSLVDAREFEGRDPRLEETLEAMCTVPVPGLTEPRRSPASSSSSPACCCWCSGGRGGDAFRTCPVSSYLGSGMAKTFVDDRRCMPGGKGLPPCAAALLLLGWLLSASKRDFLLKDGCFSASTMLFRRALIEPDPCCGNSASDFRLESTSGAGCGVVSLPMSDGAYTLSG